MKMFLNIIFFATLYPVLFIVYVVMALQSGQKNGSIFGVNMKPEWFEEDEVKAIQKRFKREMRWYGLLLAVIPFSSLLTPYFFIQMTIWLVWMFGAIILLMLLLVFANSRLKEWKRQKGYYETQSTERYVELKNAGAIRCIHFFQFFLPLAIGIIGAALALPVYKMVGISCLIGAACGFIYFLVAVIMDRQPIQVISSDSDININYSRAKKNIWKNFWLCCIWMNTILILFLLAISFVDKKVESIMLIAMIVYAVLLLVICIPVFIRLGKVEKAYAGKHDLSNGTEDDRNWIGGVLYYNPNDPHTMVDKKVGIGTTVNMASKAGKATMLFTALVFLTIPILCAWVIAEEFTPIHLEIENGNLCAEHIRTDYELPLDTIEEVEMVTELPRRSKINGTGMDNLEKGTFKIYEQGECQEFLNPQNKKFLHFSANGKQYYMSGVDDAQTEEIYKEILSR